MRTKALVWRSSACCLIILRDGIRSRSGDPEAEKLPCGRGGSEGFVGIGGRSVVICNLGINDLMDWEAFGKDDFVKDYRSLVRSYRGLPGKPRVILWQRLAPLFPGQTFFGSESVDGINAAIGQVAKLEGVETVDMQNPLESHGEWFPDHLHPNADGARAIAEVMAGYLKVSK